MDCEKFESLLIDELYGELDEVTSAAVRRHAAGCARCGALLSGFRATRKVAALPVEEPSSDLEDRILSAVREQQKVLPFRARASTVLSRAGAWAMRPQTAMAAVFLVVIGTSFVLVQSRKSAMSPMAAAEMANAEGAPVQGAAANAPMASAYSLDEKNGDFAHGVEEKRAEQQRVVTLAPSVAINDGDKDKEKAADITTTSPDGLAKKQEEVALNGGVGIGGTRDSLERTRGLTNGAGGGSAGRAGYGPGNGNSAPTTPMSVAQSQAPYGSGGASFGTAKQLYDQRRYDDARTQWDALAPADPNAALWAARADKAKNGCTSTVIQRFDQVRARSGNTPVGNEATLEAGRCYRASGNVALARARFSSLLATQSQVAAQSELDQMTPAAAHAAARKEAPARVDANDASRVQAAPQATATTNSGM